MKKILRSICPLLLLLAISLFCATALAAEWITVNSSQYPQSAHSYSNNMNETKTFTYPGATQLQITFSSSTEVESNYDYIYVYNGSGTQLAKYTGTQAAGQTLTITGDTFKIKLTSDSSVTKWGYAFSSIRALAGGTTVLYSGSCGSNVTWKIDSNGVLTFSGNGKIKGYTSDYEDEPWDDYSSSIKQVVIENGITGIGKADFNYSNLQYTVYDNGKYLGNSANPYMVLMGTTSNAITSIKIHSSTKIIYYRAFQQCDSLSTLSISVGIIDIGPNAFMYCDGLKSISVSASNSVYSSDSSGVLFNKNKTELLAAPPAMTGSYTIPNGVTSIVSDSFRNSHLSEVTIPEGVTTITYRTFLYASSLKTVSIPKSVTAISDQAFFGTSVNTVYYGGTALQWNKIYIGIDNSRIKNATRYYAPHQHTIVDGFCTECNYGCGSCGKNGNNLTWTLDENGLLTISGYGAMADYGASNIPWYKNKHTVKQVMIEDGVASIGDNAFNDCTGLTSITIPDSVISIGSYAFYSCSKLTSVTIPSSVTSIGISAFKGSNLTSVTIPSSITAISDAAFEGCSNLASITIPDSVISIGHYAFYNCSKLTSVTIPDSITAVGSSAFESCSGLTSITIPDSVISIGSNAFYNCSNLSTVIIPESVTNVGMSAFDCCSKLQYNTFSGGQYLGNPANPYLILVDATPNGITSLQIHSATKVIAGNALAYKRELASVIIPDGVITLGDCAFYGCTSLKTVTIPNSVATIESCCFMESGLTSVTIGNGVAKIGNNAFAYTGLSNIYYNGTITQWNEIDIEDNDVLLRASLICFGFDLVSQPTDQTLTEGEITEFTVKAIGSNLTYQWQYSGDNGMTWTNSSSATQGYDTDTLTVVGVLGRNGYLYRCQITDSIGEIHYTDAAKLTVLAVPLAITVQPANQTVELGKQATFAVSVNKTAKAYRWQYSKDGGANWLDATSAMTGYKSDTLTLEATKARNGYLLRCKVTDQDGNAIYSDAALLTVEDSITFLAHPQAETVKLGNRAAFTVEAEGDIKAYQWQYQMVENGPWWNCTQYTQGYNTTVLNVIAAEKRQGFLYRCRITDSNGNKYYSNTAELTVDIPESYAVLSQPKDTWVMPGKTTTFHIDTQGEGLTFQWEYHKGVDKSGPEYYWIAMSSTPGCKTDTLTIAGVSGSINRDGWAYRCVVTDPNGYVYTTDHAFLYVASAQIDAQPEDANVAPGEKAIFHAEVSGEVAKYQWQYSKDGGKSWYSSSSATQGYNTDTLTVASVSASTNRNGFLYRCIITDSQGNQLITAPAKLTVE